MARSVSAPGTAAGVISGWRGCCAKLSTRSIHRCNKRTSQIVGMMIQATSRMLKEEVTFDDKGVTSTDWVSYPVLRFAEHPACTLVVVQRINSLPPAPARG
jgi:hypothetical protein